MISNHISNVPTIDYISVRRRL